MEDVILKVDEITPEKCIASVWLFFGKTQANGKLLWTVSCGLGKNRLGIEKLIRSLEVVKNMGTWQSSCCSTALLFSANLSKVNALLYAYCK